MNVLSLLSGYSRNLHMKVIFNFHTPFHTRTPHCLTRPQAVRVTRRQTVTHPQAVTRPGTGNVHGCPLTTPNRPSRLPPSDPAIHRQADRHTTTTHPTPTTQGQPRARACEPHMQPSRREMWRQAWHMLGICMACSCLRICMACSGLPAVEGDVTELRKEHERINERLEQSEPAAPVRRPESCALPLRGGGGALGRHAPPSG